MNQDLRNQPAGASPAADVNSIVSRLLRRWLEILTSRPSRPGTWRRSSERWIAILVDEISKSLGGANVQLLSQIGSRWELISQAGLTSLASDKRNSLAETLIPLALDSPQPIVREQSVAAAIHHGGEVLESEWSANASESDSFAHDAAEASRLTQLAPTALLIHFGSQPPASSIAPLLDTIAAVASTMQSLDRQQQLFGISSDAAQHLRRLLNVSIEWAQIENTDLLLEAIASSATQMIGAERASIFLWDKKRGKLIGRPALGVEGNKLEVDDNAGIVGSVLSTGRARVWNDAQDSESEVNRAVDKRLKFKTRSIAAVPLRSPTGTLIGVFEVLNRKAGNFDSTDIVRLVDLARHAAAAIQGTETRQRLTTVRDRLLHDAASSYQVIGDCAAIRTLRDTVARVAKTDLAVLALGENGTGKEVLARSIHFQSARRDQPFVAVNCAALVESLLESELFGHERGAFTDAVQARPGKFELASGGTLFLDEIGDMSPGGQAKLLRVLEEKIVVRVGGSKPIPVDVRIIAATNQSLPELVTAKRFREDLFFRLNVVSFRLPALRDRGEDILLLADHFMAHFASQIGRIKPSFSEEAKQAMRRHRWPGNVRELRNVMERACYLSLEDTLSEGDLGLTTWDTAATLLPTSTSSNARSREKQSPSSIVASLVDATRDFQIAHILEAIANHGGNITAAAEYLGLHRSNLYRKMRQLDMKPDEDEPQ